MTEYVEYILKTIKSGLTGEYEKDIKYLHDMSEKYKNDEDSMEILTEIADIMYALLPADEREELGSRLEDMKSKNQAELEIVKNMAKAGDFNRARKHIEAIIASFEGIFEEDDNNVYISFNHIMEFYIYSYYYKPVKEVKGTDIPYNEYYRVYGFILSQLKEYEEAKKAYKQAFKWNRVDLDTLLALGEVYKYTGELEEYLEVTKQAYRYCCTRATMARYYRNLGFYYVEKYKPEVARAVYTYSNIYFKTENADNELQYIEKATNKATPPYDIATLQNILKENNIEPGPDSDTIGIIYRVGQLLLEDKDMQRAKDCFSIVYDITQDEEVEKILLTL